MKVKHDLHTVLRALNACSEKRMFYSMRYETFEDAWWGCTNASDLYWVLECFYFSERMKTMLRNAYLYGRVKSVSWQHIPYSYDNEKLCKAIRATIGLRTVQIAVNRFLWLNGYGG